ncbi:MAG: hypothetical protein AAF311_15945, partial [Pseudomonadota bacterium]
VKTVLGGMVGSAGAIAGVKEISLPVPNEAVDVVAQGVDSGIGMTGATLWDKIKSWAADFVKKMWAKIKDTFGSIANVSSFLKSVGLFVAQQVFTKAAPFIGGASTAVTGLWKFTVGVSEKFSNWVSGRTVKLNFGHPKTLVNGIEQGLTRAMLEGLYEMAKGAAQIALNAVSFGGTAIVDAVVAVVEAAIKILWRVAEYFVLKKFVEDAKTFWNARGTPGALHKDSKKFDDWLRPATEKLPVIAAVTLGSGIAGDKMRFLQMYTGTGGMITQSQFDTGVKYLDKMKRAGARVMERSDLGFSSDDKVIAGLLKLAKTHDEVHAQKKGGIFKLFRVANSVLRA